MLNKAMISSMDDVYAIFQMDDRSLIRWLSDHQLIHNIDTVYQCPKCHHPMTINFSSCFVDGAAWECHGRNRHRLSIRENSIFKSDNLGNLRISVLLFSAWALDLTPSQAKLIFPSLPNVEAISFNFHNYRLIAEKSYLNDISKAPLGGKFSIVQIDETLISKAKYNEGRALNQPPMWFFGGVDKLTGRVFIEHVYDRSANTLIPIIKKNVMRESIIYSDEWRAYSCLDKHGYFHGTVNHKKNFVNPQTLVHTQMVENVWKYLKRWIRTRNVTRVEHYSIYVHEWCFRRNIVLGLDSFFELIKIGSFFLMLRLSMLIVVSTVCNSGIQTCRLKFGWSILIANHRSASQHQQANSIYF